MKVHISPYKSIRRIDYVRIDNYDIWNMDMTLAKVILPMLLLFKQNCIETGGGCPSEFTNGMPENHFDQFTFDFINETSDAAFRVALKKWYATIDLMIWSFYHIAHATDFNRLKEVPAEYAFYGSRNEFSERIQEGLDVFAKYYNFLWD